jgi:FkbM family methyltransferase
MVSPVYDVIYHTYDSFKINNILECGASYYNQLQTHSALKQNKNVWYVEPTEGSYLDLKNKGLKNVINGALTTYDGEINFTVAGNLPCNSSISHSDKHEQELNDRNIKMFQTKVPCYTYETILEKANCIFDLLILDVEGHEKPIIESFTKIDRNKLPKIIAIECGYYWKNLKPVLFELDYVMDYYYFNNCYLRLNEFEIKKDDELINKINQEYNQFVFNGHLVYENEISSI